MDQEYKATIYAKLRNLEKKITLSYRSSSNPDKKLELRKYLTILENMFRKLEQNILTWEDLKTIGISKKTILSQVGKKEFVPKQFEDFPNLSQLTIQAFLEENYIRADSINILYSIVEYINNNYQTIFTQKILLSASKTNSIRELFYMQYQDIFHIFHSYKSYVLIPSTSEEHKKMVDKEYLHLVQATYNFFNSIQSYISLLSKDQTFSPEDFQQQIKSTDSKSCIYGLTLKEALKECLTFTEEALDYLQSFNKDIFDSLSLNQEIQSKFN
ncbi:MAG: hypothetical protein ACRCWI_06400 [Brevinema sp.]